jgi:hypothetical protein
MRPAFLLLLPIVQAFVRRRTTMPSADFCRTIRVGYPTLSPGFRDVRQISRDKPDRLQRATAEFTTSALDGYGLRGHLPARPAPYASYPVLVHRLASLLHASFRPRLATTPLRFAITSPPSGCEGDLHPQAVKHARRTRKSPGVSDQGKRSSEMVCGDLLSGGNCPVKLSRRLLVLGEHDVDLRVGRNGNYYAAVGVEVHDF